MAIKHQSDTKELYAIGATFKQDIAFSVTIFALVTLGAFLVAFWCGIDPFSFIKLVLK